MTDKIEAGLAVAIAGQVSAGIAAGDGREERAVAALTAIGLMLMNASGDEVVEAVLQSAEKTHVTRLPGGGWRIEGSA